ncbi:MAG: ATP-binding protein, partial [Candidatus Edwardsbacteria bacterium]|nr:ATP-binding protein [Candidatus Edwardsbacteria bacterium]MBU1576435.1 ATP-binding protein [Candidatus Edwardsbacteria bacterium]MBU2464052.1 ATP-binding protein [Candidatus Edwardsbacteria bacterium]
KLSKEGKFYWNYANKDKLVELYKNKTHGIDYYTDRNDPINTTKASSFEDICPTFNEVITAKIQNLQNIFITSHRSILLEQPVSNVNSVLENGNGSKVPGYVFESLHNGQLSDQKSIIKNIVKEVENFFGFKTGVSINPLKYNSGVLFSLEEINKQELPITFYGQGTISIFLLIFYLKFHKLYNKPLLMFIDEPENSLHPGLQKKVLKYFIDEIKENKNIQLFIATHSPSFVEFNENTSVYYVDNGVENDKVFKRITKENITAVLDPIGFTMSHVGLADVVIFVEGVTELFVLREFLLAFDDTADAINANRIIFHNIGGDNYSHIKPEDMLKISLKPVIWMDSELDRSPAEGGNQQGRENFIIECDKMGILTFFNKSFRNIENLLSKKAIAKILKTKVSNLSGFGPYDLLNEYMQEVKQKDPDAIMYNKDDRCWKKAAAMAQEMVRNSEVVNNPIIKDFHDKIIEKIAT